MTFNLEPVIDQVVHLCLSGVLRRCLPVNLRFEKPLHFDKLMLSHVFIPSLITASAHRSLKFVKRMSSHSCSYDL